MTPTIPPPGWYFDDGDPSVGWYGAGWVHEDCPAVEGAEVDTREQIIATRYEGAGVNRSCINTFEVSCTGCGDTFVIEDPQWDPDEWPE